MGIRVLTFADASVVLSLFVNDFYQHPTVESVCCVSTQLTEGFCKMN
jgi:hypothetical protein